MLRAAVFWHLRQWPLRARSGDAQIRRVCSTPESGPVSVRSLGGRPRASWGAVLLPDGDMLVTERPGRLRLVSGRGSRRRTHRRGPGCLRQGQGGLLDVALDPGFRHEQDWSIYPLPRNAMRRGYLGRPWPSERRRHRTSDFKVIFPAGAGSFRRENHFGSRLAFAPDGKLFITLGERFTCKRPRIRPTISARSSASIPTARYRTTTPSSAARAPTRFGPTATATFRAPPIHPETDVLWTAEMGRWGDELNIPEAGKNYGWPVVSWADIIRRERIPDPPSRPEFAGSIHSWTPVISPSGMMFLYRRPVRDGRGDLLIGGLSRAVSSECSERPEGDREEVLRSSTGSAISSRPRLARTRAESTRIRRILRLRPAN